MLHEPRANEAPAAGRKGPPGARAVARRPLRSMTAREAPATVPDGLRGAGAPRCHRVGPETGGGLPPAAREMKPRLPEGLGAARYAEAGRADAALRAVVSGHGMCELTPGAQNKAAHAAAGKRLASRTRPPAAEGESESSKAERGREAGAQAGAGLAVLGRDMRMARKAPRG